MALNDIELYPLEIPIEKSHEIVVAGVTMSGVTTQLELQEDEWTPDDAILPPLDMDKLAKLSEASSTRGAIIDAMARNTVGLGYELHPAEGHEQEVGDVRDEAREARGSLEAASQRDVRLDRPSFTDLLVAVKTDEEETGNGYIEVARDVRSGKISGIFHAPGRFIRRLKDRTGYVMLDPTGMGTRDEKVYFHNFGEKAEYDGEGNPTGVLPGKGGRNEILSFRLYTSESRDYGLPRDAGLALEYLADKLAAEFNISFFDSGGVPPAIIFIQGEEVQNGGRVRLVVPQSTVQRIGDTLTSSGGKQKRVAIVPLPAGARPTVEKLGEVAERDMGFVKYRQDNIQRMLGAFRMAPIFIAYMTDSGRYDAEVQRSLTLEQLFDPEQVRYEKRITYTILKDLGFGNLALQFKRMAAESNAARRESVDAMAEAGDVTLREHRAAHGYGPLPETSGPEDVLEPGSGLYPKGINDRLVNTGTPRGAENRVPTSADDQRGLRPGVGAREQRSTDEELARAARTNGNS